MGHLNTLWISMKADPWRVWVRVRRIGQAWASCIMISLCCCTAHCLQQQHSFTAWAQITHTYTYVPCLWFSLRPYEDMALNMYRAHQSQRPATQGWNDLLFSSYKTILMFMSKVFNTAKQLSEAFAQIHSTCGMVNMGCLWFLTYLQRVFHSPHSIELLATLELIRAAVGQTGV